MARLNEPDMPPKRTTKDTIRYLQYQNSAIETSGCHNGRHDHWLTNCEFEYGKSLKYMYMYICTRPDDYISHKVPKTEQTKNYLPSNKSPKC